MTLTRETGLGRVTINDNVIAKALIRACTKAGNRLYLATDKGKILGEPSKTGTGDLAGNFIIDEEGDSYRMVFYVVLNFGASIKKVTDTVLDALCREMQSMFPHQKGIFTMVITGVKSKNIAPRNIEVTRIYEPAR